MTIDFRRCNPNGKESLEYSVDYASLHRLHRMDSRSQIWTDWKHRIVRCQRILQEYPQVTACTVEVHKPEAIEDVKQLGSLGLKTAWMMWDIDFYRSVFTEMSDAPKVLIFWTVSSLWQKRWASISAFISLHSSLRLPLRTHLGLSLKDFFWWSTPWTSDRSFLSCRSIKVGPSEKPFRTQNLTQTQQHQTQQTNPQKQTKPQTNQASGQPHSQFQDKNGEEVQVYSQNKTPGTTNLTNQYNQSAKP